MNVAIITDSFPPMMDGVSRCALGYAKALTDGKYGNCIVVTPRMPHIKYDYPFPVYGFSSVGIPYADYRAGHPFLPFLVSACKDMKIDILHAHSPFTSMIFARELRRLLKIPVVFTQHTKWDFDIAQAISSKVLQRELEHYVYKNISKADDVWAVSRGAGEHMQSRGYKGDFIVMPNATDFAKSQIDPERIAKLARRWDIPEGVPVLIFVGRMMWYKNIALIFEALSILIGREFDFRMFLIGDGEDYADIKRDAADRGLQKHVIFTGRISERDELMAYYSLSDLLVFLSTYDNAPLVVQEAAACACPALVVRGSSTSEVLVEGKSGFFIEESAMEAADAIQAAFSDRKLLGDVSKAAFEEVYMPWDKAVKQAVERYEYVKSTYTRKRSRKTSV